jgi:hypothetical protein
MACSAQIIVSHISGEQMKAQGMDGVSRGQMKEGVTGLLDMMSFIPFHQMPSKGPLVSGIALYHGWEQIQKSRPHKIGLNGVTMSLEGLLTQRASGAHMSNQEISSGCHRQWLQMQHWRSYERLASNVNT